MAVAIRHSDCVDQSVLSWKLTWPQVNTQGSKGVEDIGDKSELIRGDKSKVKPGGATELRPGVTTELRPGGATEVRPGGATKISWVGIGNKNRIDTRW